MNEPKIGQLCWAWNRAPEKKLGLLRVKVVRSVCIDEPVRVDYALKGFKDYFRNCEPLTKEEIQQFMELAE